MHWERDLAVTLHAAAAPTIGASADSADALGRHVAATLAGAQCLGKLRSTGADSLALLVAIRSEPRDPLPPRATASGDTARFALEVDVPALPRAEVNIMPTYPRSAQVAGVAVPQVVYQPAFFGVAGGRIPAATPPNSMIVIGYKMTVRQPVAVPYLTASPSP